MKTIYRCDWCDKTGTLDEITKHEKSCIHNKDLHSCFTCGNCNKAKLTEFHCKAGKAIPKGSYYEKCPIWIDGGNEKAMQDPFSFLFGDLFSGGNNGH